MDIARFAELLKRSIGLDMATVGESAIEAAVKTRLAKSKLGDAQLYLQHLHGSALELAHLIDETVIAETWFFRDPEAMWAMARDALARAAEPAQAGPFRVLSLPCASGEEPYSLAMALLEGGFAGKPFQIDAMDISQRVLERAQRAVYGRNSFRGALVEPFRDRYFDHVETGWRLRDEIRDLVDFQQGNLLEARYALVEAAYDVIFCRNLLIYFDRETQDRAVGLLLRLLKPGGTLYVGPAEGGLLLEHGLRSTGVPLAFGFQRCASPNPAPGEIAPRPRKIRPSELIKAPPAPARTATQLKLADKPIPKPQQPAASSSLEQIAALADAGRLPDAISQCEAFLRTHGPSAQALCLLGLAQDACGELAQAEQNYRKALYLDPAHRDTLTHLALLLEARGDAAAARQLRQRAARQKVPDHG